MGVVSMRGSIVCIVFILKRWLERVGIGFIERCLGGKMSWGGLRRRCCVAGRRVGFLFVVGVEVVIIASKVFVLTTNTLPLLISFFFPPFGP